MKEESQIQDMRAALRGDRERAEQARQRSLENVRALIETSEPDPESQERQRQGVLGSLFRRR